MNEVILIVIAILLVLIAIPIVYFLAKKIGHGLKHIFFTALVCIMLTSIIQLGIFYFIMKFGVFSRLCEFGFNCSSLFSGFMKFSLFSSIGIFAILISVYYLFKFLKGIFKIAIVVGGIILIVIACVVVYKSFVPTDSVFPDTSLCVANEDCIIIQEKGNASAMNKQYIGGRLEDIPNSINESLSCMYSGVCIENSCGVVLRENVSSCGNSSS